MRDFGHCHFCGAKFGSWLDSYDHPQICLNPPKSMLSWFLGEIRGYAEEIPSKVSGFVQHRVNDVKEFADFVVWCARGLVKLPRLKAEERWVWFPFLIMGWVPIMWLSTYFPLAIWLNVLYMIGIILFGSSMAYQTKWKRSYHTNLSRKEGNVK